MHVALDARAMSNPQRGGFKTYATGLTHALAKVGSNHRFTWYIDRPLDKMPIPGNVRVQSIRQLIPYIGMAIREQMQLPIQLLRERPDVVHFLSNTAPAWSPTPMVVVIHDTLQLRNVGLDGMASPTWQQTLMRRYGTLFLKRAGHRARLVITDSEASKQALISAVGVPPDRIRVIYPGVRPIFRPMGTDEPLPYALRPGFILAMASPDGRKDPTTVLSAYAGLPSAIQRQAPLVIVSSSDSVVHQLAAQAAALRVSPLLLTDVSDKMLARLYRAALIFTFPSLGEGFGLPVLEAMASGTAVIASDISSIPEVAGDAAILIPPRDPRAMAAALRHLITNTQHRQELALRGQQRATAFSWDVSAVRTLEAYEEALATPYSLVEASP